MCGESLNLACDHPTLTPLLHSIRVLKPANMAAVEDADLIAVKQILPGSAPRLPRPIKEPKGPIPDFTAAVEHIFASFAGTKVQCSALRKLHH
jgi:hypothetical protein